ncbi:colon cancer-associated protein Mic1-like-domain-containing protein [Phlyctochytrium arcticum]|nr:colon cancer-associated protein Mic1-like-domain-containing protein [Phlyctochytrium arcticum]
MSARIALDSESRSQSNPIGSSVSPTNPPNLHDIAQAKLQPLSFHTVLSFDHATDITTIFIDPTRKGVLVLRNDCEAEVFPGDGSESFLCNVGSSGAIRDIKVCTDAQFIGVIRSAKSLEIVGRDRKRGIFQIIEQDSRSSDAVLGFEWLGTNDLILVTTRGIELYQFSEPKAKFIKKLNKKARINWYSYWAEEKMLVTCADRSTLQLYRVFSCNLEQMPGLTIRAKATSESVEKNVTRRQIFILCIYGKLFYGYLDDSPPFPFFELYEILPTRVQFFAHLPLESCGKFVVNVVDNILVLFNLSNKTYLLFDVWNGCSQPLLPILPVDHVNYCQEWRGCYEDCILVANEGRLECIRLDFSPIAYAMGDSTGPLQIINILLRRQHCSPIVILLVLREMVIKEASMSELRQAFDLVNQRNCNNQQPPAPSCHEARTEGPTNRDESTKMLAGQDNANWTLAQIDIFSGVFLPLQADMKVSSRHQLRCCVEFIASAGELGPCSSSLQQLLVKLLISTENHAEVPLYVQNNIVEDSLTIAQVLLEHSGDYGPFRQLGLDMLHRLNATNRAIETLISEGQTYQAMMYSIKATSTQPSHYDLFMERALSSGDKTLFLNVYRHFEEQGLSSVGTNRISSHPIDRYASLFREMWGEVVEMDSLIDI